MHVSSFTCLAISVGDADDLLLLLLLIMINHDDCHSLKPIFLDIKALPCITT
jgi:hypothetical protein